MTVQNTNTKNIYVGNGSTTVFPFTFYAIKDKPEYIKVYITGADGVDILTNNYTIDMQAQNVTYPKNGSPLKQGEKITIARELPLLQDLNLVNQGPFLAEDIEESFDKNTMLAQQLKEKLDRALVGSISVDIDKFDATIPVAPGKGIRINDNGTGFETTDDPKFVYEATVGMRNETEQLRNQASGFSANADSKASAAAISAGNAKTSETSARNSELEAIRQADRAEAYGSKGEVYDSSKTYSPADVVMVSNGNLYRCIVTSTGENPIGSNKWVPVSMVDFLAFEADENGDLMPRLTPVTATNEGWETDVNGDIMPVA